MRSRASLTLIEQLVMLLVFALAAALCLQAFVWADNRSAWSENRDRAVALCQSTAEAIRQSGGDVEHALSGAAGQLGAAYGAFADEGAPLELHYNEDWSLSDTRDYAFCLRAEGMDSGIAGLCKARVSVAATGDAAPLFELEVAWQGEVATHE